ncbi:hypothetical protein [Caballeronia sordidicola]|uniref:hypothetical protein n=1 Tax=Caballeronia sordidicola TaxID=196367 RepID=UPI0004CFEC2E|nr:hypothetical protein [Caballeronia sordidicola]
MAADEKVVGTATSYMTPTDYKQRALVERNVCDKMVPAAAASIVGTCPYYYRPLHGEYWETVEKVSVSSTWEAVKAWAKFWDPYRDHATFATLLHRREKLIEAESTDSDWSRHGNFMMRHVGCGHKPPGYYVSYGYYYCSTYGAKLFPKLSPSGQAWLVLAKKKLQVHMEDGLHQNMTGNTIKMTSEKGNRNVRMSPPQFGLELNDETFTSFAFETHPLAYLEGGLADLGFLDLWYILGEPNMQEWGDGRTWGQAKESSFGMASIGLNKVEESANKFRSETSELVDRALNRLMER